MLERLRAEHGLSYLFISHDMALVERIYHRVAVMYAGRLVEIGARDQVLHNPSIPIFGGSWQRFPFRGWVGAGISRACRETG
ncbi:hypothetical protein [Pseudomonas sp. DC3200b2]|uniref:hypothetical protein n=1 Tax=Pseudomonas sp. DC3200b2 TaxID=2804669 RepID=UPI003CF58AA8